MSDILPTYYWDSCIFLECLRRESVTPQKRHAVQRLLRDNKDRKNIIFTSVIAHLECLPKKLSHEDAEREKEYQSMFGTRFFFDVQVSSQILFLARDIRDYYYSEAEPKANKPYRMMQMGDAIHLATAIIEGATIFHTRDGSKKGGNIALLGLPESSAGGKIAGRFDLSIVSPEDPQTDLVDLAEEVARAPKP